MGSAIAASRLADMVRVALAAQDDVRGERGGPLYVTLRLHEGEDVGLGERRVNVRSVVVRRLYTGRNKALENDSLWDVLVGAELVDGGLLAGTFTYATSARVSVRVSTEPPVEGAAPFEGVFTLKSVSVPGIH